ncbi:hypothetical protein LCGC14_1649470 [marine sediment metagenome]|uniref:Carbohydrate kinase FGGY N-terminal domain-containing protein n=1 Tax=marine sediment metagenome TaxID=412755 RepID=A0A0F9IJU5_9ZZZZ
MADFLLGCDVGTSSTKSAVIDLEGRVLGSHSRAYSLMQNKGHEDGFPGIKAEHRPDEDYWESVAETMRFAVQEARIDPREIRGISVSALSPACILVDKRGRPLQNAHIWMDRRATAECEWIRERIGDDRVFATSANPIDPYFATAKLLWEKRNRPHLYEQTYKLQTAADYPVLCLTGKAVTDYSNAGLIGIAFDIQKRQWDTAMLEELGLDPEKFPEPFPCDEVIGEVTREAAEKCGLYPGIPVVAGTVDCSAAWVAGGAVDDWLDTLPHHEAKQLLEIRKRGSTSQVIALLDRFKEESGYKQPVPETTETKEPAGNGKDKGKPKEPTEAQKAKRTAALAASEAVPRHSGGPPAAEPDDTDFDGGFNESSRRPDD